VSVISTRSTAVINAPAEFAWLTLSEYSHDTRWRKGLVSMRQMTPGAVFEGAVVEEVLVVLGRTIRSTVHVTTVADGESFSWEVSSGSRAHGSRTVRVIDSQTSELELVKTVILEGFDRVLHPLVALIMRRTERGDARRAGRIIETTWASN